MPNPNLLSILQLLNQRWCNWNLYMLKKISPILPSMLNPGSEPESPARPANSDSRYAPGTLQAPSEAMVNRINARKRKFLAQGGSNILTGMQMPGRSASVRPATLALPTPVVVGNNIKALRAAIECQNMDYLPLGYRPNAFWKEKIPLLIKWLNDKKESPDSLPQSYQEAKPHLTAFAPNIALLHSDHRTLLLAMMSAYLRDEETPPLDKVKILSGILAARNAMSVKILKIFGGLGRDANIDIEKAAVIQFSNVLREESNLDFLVCNLSNPAIFSSPAQRKPVIDFFAQYMRATKVDVGEKEDFLLLLLERAQCFSLPKAESERLQSLLFEGDNVAHLVDRLVSDGDLDAQFLTLLDRAEGFLERPDVSLNSRRTVLAHLIEVAIRLGTPGAAVSEAEHQIMGRVDALLVDCVVIMNDCMLECIGQHQSVLPSSARSARSARLARANRKIDDVAGAEACLIPGNSDAPAASGAVAESEIKRDSTDGEREVSPPGKRHRP